jgi:hypothetical protein
MTRTTPIIRTIDNPFDGVSINLDFLGPAFTTYWQWWLGGLWGAVLIVATFNLLLALRHLRHIKSENNAQKKSDAKGKLIGAIAWLGAAVILPVIIAAIFYFANRGQ